MVIKNANRSSHSTAAKQPNAKTRHDPLNSPTDRELFYYLLRIEDYPEFIDTSGNRLADAFRIQPTLSRRYPGELELHAKLSRLLKKRLKETLNPDTSDRQTLSSIFKAAKAYVCLEQEKLGAANAADALYLVAPTLLMQPCWLQNIGQASLGHRVDTAPLFDIFSRSVGRNTQADLVRQQVRWRLRQNNIELPPLDQFSAIARSKVPDWIFTPPVIYLSLANNTRIFLPEILGFTYAYILSPVSLNLFSHLDQLSRPEISPRGFRLDPSAKKEENLRKAIQYHLKTGETQADSLWERIQSGLDLYLSLHLDLISKVSKRLRNPPTRTEKVIAIFRDKAEFAAGHHRNRMLGNRLLDEWFSTEHFKGPAFLNELLKAGYFDLDNPQNSRFFTNLTAFDGPMFGVFTQAEVDTIADWLTHSQEPEHEVSELNFDDPSRVTPPSFKSVEYNGRPISNRDLYHALLNPDRRVPGLRSARSRVNEILKRSKRLAFRNSTPFAQGPYQHTQLKKDIDQFYRREMGKYSEFQAPAKISKQVYRWAIQQFAPTILVDGCWLQNIAGVSRWDSPIPQKLFRIFADEIGNGISERNHPNVYRKLLASLEIELPEFDSEPFAQHPCFVEAAFDIPSYLLAISQFPNTYLPEIIGLNLAIELGGLGRSYQRLVDELRYWGIDPQIITLHISIDNLASGHAAIATDIIMEYMDQIASQQGRLTAQIHWRRIRWGYRSLGVASQRFKFQLLRGFFSAFLMPKLYRSARAVLVPLSIRRLLR